MKYKIKQLYIIALIILLTSAYFSTEAVTNDNIEKDNLQQIDTTAPVIYFDLSGINSTHNITHVTVFEPDSGEFLSYAEVYVNSIVHPGAFSLIDYTNTSPPISPIVPEAWPSGDKNTYDSDVDTEADFTEGQHNDIEATGTNTDGISSQSIIIFCNNQECWSAGLIPLARKSTSTDTQKPPKIQSIDESGPLIKFNLTKLACCGFVYFNVSDPDSGIVSIETSFIDNTLVVNATNDDYVTTKTGINFGNFEVKGIYLNDTCEDCETCETCPTIPDTFPTNFSVFTVIPILTGTACIVVLRRRKLKK